MKDRPNPKGQGGQAVFTQDDQAALVGDPNAKTYRKKSRILAVQLSEPFMVHTDRGPMSGQPGDWLVTNHPEDDPGSDLWTISDERMKSTYDPAQAGPHKGEPHAFKTTCSICGQYGTLFVAILGPTEKATIGPIE